MSCFCYLTVLPLTIGASILRYRLYDLDRILSRTLAWTLLTVVLGLGYGMVVLALGRLVPDSSSLAGAGAAIFQPARRRIQQVDLDRLRAELLAVADQTMQPTTVSLWLRPRG